MANIVLRAGIKKPLICPRNKSVFAKDVIAGDEEQEEEVWLLPHGHDEEKNVTERAD